MVFKNLGVLVLWMRVASALEGLRIITMLCFMSKEKLSIRVKRKSPGSVLARI